MDTSTHLTAPSVSPSSPSILRKAFDVLEVFDQGHQVLTLSDISRRSGLPKSTAHRIMTILLDIRAVERVGQDYRVGLRMFAIGSRSAEARLRDTALPHLERLRRLTRQTVHLAVLDDTDVVYLEKLPSNISPATPATVGGQLPAESTGVGRALLAFARPLSAPPTGSPDQARLAKLLASSDYLRNVRLSGIASEREKAARGLACMAAPILVGNKAFAAISVSFTAGDGDGQLFVNPLRETSAAISRALAGSACTTADRSI
ncbi:IclR family transcriptional regulator [Rhodococcus sp. MEB064]|uniref:IclR family transcriptional regulator n=1 Tax=Rhodococcus sp. MEB064 TaxID=1587522 RepID=UPI000A54D934|nr:IclR family transcriptional regulator [Rhodococcus sp. MEB064]